MYLVSTSLILFLDYFDTYVKSTYGASTPDLTMYLTTLTKLLVGMFTKSAGYHAFYPSYFVSYYL